MFFPVAWMQACLLISITDALRMADTKGPGARDTSFPIPPHVLCEAVEPIENEDSRERASQTIEHLFKAPARCLADGSGWRPLLGCRCLPRNVCREHDGATFCEFLEEHVKEPEDALRLGGPCCENKQAGLKKAAAAVLNFTVGQCWEVASLSRWTYVSKLQQRSLLLGAIDCMQPMIHGVRDGLGIDMSLEKMLERELALDQDNFALRNKLKVCRICRIMLGPTAMEDMAITAVGNSAVDEIHYKLLGHGKAQARCTLFDMVDPSTSIVARCEHALVEALIEFDALAVPWLLLRLFTVDFTRPSLRLRARASLIKHSTGVEMHFTRRLSQPPLSLVAAMPAVQASDTWKRERLAEFLAIPLECLPLGAQRLRRSVTTVADCYAVLPTAIGPLLQRSGASTDASERSHAQMRQDMSSATRSRKFGEGSTRVACHD